MSATGLRLPLATLGCGIRLKMKRWRAPGIPIREEASRIIYETEDEGLPTEVCATS